MMNTGEIYLVPNISKLHKILETFQQTDWKIRYKSMLYDALSFLDSRLALNMFLLSGNDEFRLFYL